jgi:membrane-bound serine protease (ClpP class)
MNLHLKELAVEMLLNPNLFYLLLVAGVLLAIMALFSPGTGVLELGAFFLLLIAGWGIYKIPINLWALGLLVLGVFPFILAVRRSRQIIFLVIALVAFVIGSTYLYQGERWYLPGVHPLLVIVVSLLSVGYLWIATVKVLEADHRRPSHDLAGLIGKLGEAKTAIYNEGSVQVARELWSARSARPIPDGSRVRVTRRDGLILEVEPVDHPES